MENADIIKGQVQSSNQNDVRTFSYDNTQLHNIITILSTTHPAIDKQDDSNYDNNKNLNSKYARTHITMKDILYNYIDLSTIVVQIINTTIFQRLRYLKQLGLCFYVYPSAGHSRFEHSIGTSYLANLMMTTLQEKQPEIGITKREIELVSIAALCHDLGHGPYSHMFESWLHRKGIIFHHEDMSIKLFKLLVKNNSIPLNEIEIEMVCHMILGKIFDKNREFMYQIVNDKTASIDVDKFDYLVRDCRMTGKQCSFSVEQLIRNCRVIKGKLCYDKKEIRTIDRLFRTRYDMFQEIYLHKTVKAIELMFLDALDYIDKNINFENYINDPNEYVKLTDSFITYWVEFGLLNKPEDPNLLAAQEIFTSIKLRKIYKNILCQRWIFYGNQREYLNESKINDELIAMSNGSLIHQDIRVEIITLNYGMMDINPVKNVLFYDKLNYNKFYEINDSYDSVTVPKTCIEHYVRIYMTNPDDIYKKMLLVSIFNDFAKKHGQSVDYNGQSVDEQL